MKTADLVDFKIGMPLFAVNWDYEGDAWTITEVCTDDWFVSRQLYGIAGPPRERVYVDGRPAYVGDKYTTKKAAMESVRETLKQHRLSLDAQVQQIDSEIAALDTEIRGSNAQD